MGGSLERQGYEWLECGPGVLQPVVKSCCPAASWRCYPLSAPPSAPHPAKPPCLMHPSPRRTTGTAHSGARWAKHHAFNWRPDKFVVAVIRDAVCMVHASCQLPSDLPPSHFSPSSISTPRSLPTLALQSSVPRPGVLGTYVAYLRRGYERQDALLHMQMACGLAPGGLQDAAAAAAAAAAASGGAVSSGNGDVGLMAMHQGTQHGLLSGMLVADGLVMHSNQSSPGTVLMGAPAAGNPSAPHPAGAFHQQMPTLMEAGQQQQYHQPAAGAHGLPFALPQQQLQPQQLAAPPQLHHARSVARELLVDIQRMASQTLAALEEPQVGVGGQSVGVCLRAGACLLAAVAAERGAW